MKASDLEKQTESLIKYLKAKMRKPVFVLGMWSGDFIGTVEAVGWTQVSFRAEKPIAGGIVKVGDTFTFPYSRAMRVRELTDEEAQITISESVGDIEIA